MAVLVGLRTEFRSARAGCRLGHAADSGCRGHFLGVLARETCCGEPARRAGDEYLFTELSGKLVESFEARRIKKEFTALFPMKEGLLTTDN